MTIKLVFTDLIKEQKKLKTLEREFNLQKRLVEGLRTSMMSEMTAAGTIAFAGKGGRLALRSSVVPMAEDWNKIYSYIHDNVAFDLLQRRLSATAYRDRVENGETIPGTSSFNKDTLYITLLE